MDLDVNGTVYTIANTYGPITYNGITYVGLGHFLGMNEIQDDLKATTAQLQISLSGIPKDPGEAGLGSYSSYVSLILNTPLKGSRIRIYRVFFNTETRELLSSSVSLRFNGYVSNFTITDASDIQSRTETYTCVLSLTNILGIIDRKIVGRRTNTTDQKYYYPTDTGMDRVNVISNTSFDFGKPYTGGGTGGGSGSGGSFYDPFNANDIRDAG
jgi:hypothetical protein